jgi:hypothetical protein
MVDGFPRDATAPERAVLSHPDRVSRWVVIARAHLREAIPESVISDRLAALHEHAPIVGARLQRRSWVAGSPPTPRIVASLSELDVRFELEAEPPVRVGLDSSGRSLAVAVHHAAFDGLAVLSIVRSLMGFEVPVLDGVSPTERRGGLWSGLRRAALRIARPSARVSASRARAEQDVFAHALLPVIDYSEGRSNFTERLVTACSLATIDRENALGRRPSRLGISVGVGVTRGLGNAASYRRIEVRASEGLADEVAGALKAALGRDAEPPELLAPSLFRVGGRVLSAVADRAGDTLLVSNLGATAVPQANRLEFYPVARGRSGLAFGCVTNADQPPVLTIRSATLSQKDAEELVRNAASRFG